MAKAHRSTKNFKVSMKPSTISQIHFDEEDELISLIHQLDCDEIGDTELFQIENLSSCSKKQIARTLVRNDRRTLNQQKQEKYLKKLSDKQRRAHQHSLIDQIQERDLSQIHLQYTDRSHVVTVEQPFSISKLKEVCRRVFDLGEMQFEFFIESELVDDDVLSILLSDTVVSLQVVLAPIKMPFFAMEEEAYLDCLPILRDSVKADLLAAIESSPVVVLVGDTGCGKSTQVPQILLDHSSTEASIICTQPRRIAAISIAERVAAERSQCCGDTVGYHVRLHANFSDRTKILYCTTGVLLMKLQDPCYLNTITHLVIDEVHERQIETDFLMALIRHQMKNCPHLKLILMSATVHSQMIMSYFAPCALVSVSGRVFPVQDYYIDDVYSLIRVGQMMQSGISTPSSLPDDLLCLPRTSTKQIHFRVSEEVIVEFTIRLIQRENNLKAVGELNCASGETILIFLPGIQVIDKVHRLFRSRQILSSLKATIFILHSTLSPSQQRKVFNPTPSGEWKIVLSTNIAESSVTLDNVTHVIDTGLVREMRYDSVSQISTLSTTFCSRSSLTQRKGRAGRVRSGTCWRLFPKDWMTNEHFDDYPVPEMRRVALEDVCLQCLFLNLGNPEEFLSTCIEPPSREQVHDALILLQNIGAIIQSNMATLKYEITPLGIHLARLPLDVKLGKMLIYACLFDCVDPLLTVASTLGGKSPLLHPLDDKDGAASVHGKFSTQNHQSFTVPISRSTHFSKNPYFPYSDHLSVIRIFDYWCYILATEGKEAAFEFCRANYLSYAVLEDIYDIRQQFRIYLEKSNLFSVGSENQRGFRIYSEDLVRFAICAGLFPKIARVCMVQKYTSGKGKKIAKYTQKILNKNDQELVIHKSSILSRHTSNLLGRNPDEVSRKELFLASHKIIASPTPSIYDATSISPVALMLFGQSFSETSKGSHRTRVIVDGWIHFEMSELHAAIVRRVQSEIDDLLVSLVSDPIINRRKQNIINLILSKILSHDICN